MPEHPTTGPVSRAEVALLAAIVLGTGLLHGATIREGHGWLDDFASYVAHARTIAEDQPYDDTGYVYNPDHPVAGPRAYPPVYPLMLAPVYAAAGLDLHAMKLQLVFVLGVLLVVGWILLRRWHPPWVALAATAAVGFSPFIWSFKDNVLSDIPFALFVALAVLLIDVAERAPPAQPAIHGLVVGVACYLAYGTRAVGAVLIPAMLLHLWLARRRVPRFAWYATGVFAVLALAQMALVPGGSGYTDTLALASPRLTLTNAWRYLRSLEGLTVNGYVAAAGTALFLLVTGLAAIGYLTRLPRARRTVVETLVPLYVLTIAVWPAFQSLRFLVPLLPFYAAYAAVGASWAGRWLGGEQRRGEQLARAAPALLGVAIALSYLGVYARLDYGPLPEGVGTPAAEEMFDWVRANTDPEDLLLFLRPKALALYTDRRAAAPAPDWDAAGVLAYADRAGAGYLVDGPVDPGRFAVVVADRPGVAREMFRNGEFTIWRLGAGAERDDQGAGVPEP